MNSEPSKPLRFLVVGCGGIASAHLPAFEKYPERLKLVAAADPYVSARENIALRLKEHGEIELFDGPEAALGRMADQIDAVLVLTPHHLHLPAALAAVSAGKPVLVEKPVTLDLAEARTLNSASDKARVSVMVGQSRRFDPTVQAMKEWVQSDPQNFGELRSFEMSGWQNIEAWIACKPDKNADFWILDKERAGGGVVVSLLIHYIDIIRYLFDVDYSSVVASGRFDPPFKNGAESAASALLTTTTGATGTMHANYLTRKTPYCESFKAFGDNGVVGNHPLAFGEYSGPSFVGGLKGEPVDGWGSQFSGVAEIEPSMNSLDADIFVNQLLEFESSIREGREPESSLAKNMNTMATVEAIYQSINNGGSVVEVPAC